MTDYLNDIRSVALDFTNELEQSKEDMKNVQNKYEAGSISKQYYESKMEKLKPAGSSKAVSEINDVVKRYEDDLSKWAVLNADDLSDDLKLLDSSIRLEKSDYKALEEKHKNNYSMLKAIHDDASKNDVSYISNYSLNKDEKLKELNEFSREARKIMTAAESQGKRPYMARVWEKEDNFNNMYDNLQNFIKI